MQREVLLQPGEDGYIVVKCPSLPGCISQGKTEEEALVNIKEAIELWIEDAEARGIPIPEDSHPLSPTIKNWTGEHSKAS